jgi:hypothetical protein
MAKVMDYTDPRRDQRPGEKRRPYKAELLLSQATPNRLLAGDRALVNMTVMVAPKHPKISTLYAWLRRASV